MKHLNRLAAESFAIKEILPVRNATKRIKKTLIAECKKINLNEIVSN